MFEHLSFELGKAEQINEQRFVVNEATLDSGVHPILQAVMVGVLTITLSSCCLGTWKSEYSTRCRAVDSTSCPED